jgi:signal transduction histidine kinase
VQGQTSGAIGYSATTWPDAFQGLAAVARVARAAVSVVHFGDLAQQTLVEMREALGLDVAALFLPDPAGRPALHRVAVAVAPGVDVSVRGELDFDAEAWGLVTTGQTPLILRESASWLVEHPFTPPRTDWLILPLVSAGRPAGSVVAAGPSAEELSPARITTLISLGDLLSSAVSTARLRQELERTAVERERMRLAAELHDGLAQDLALAVREIATLRASAELRSDPLGLASLERLAEAVADAHRVVRAGLEDLTMTVPLGGIGGAIERVADRFRERGLVVHSRFEGPIPSLTPDQTATVIRVLVEALTNVLRHAGTGQATALASVEASTMRLAIEDGGPGLPEGPLGRPGDGHFGLTIMRERARAVGGDIQLGRAASGGTRVELILPLDDA